MGPAPGVDVSVLDVSSGRVMIANCDPISLIPSLGPTDSARMSVFEVASDVATSGQPPRYGIFDLNLPPKMSDRVLEEYWKSIHSTCREIGVSILGGHTGRFVGCDYSIVGAATMWTICSETEYLTSDMARDGDDLILTKTAAYGATAVLSKAFPNTVRRFLGSSLFRKASNYLLKMNTVDESLAAVRVGIHDEGVTAIHNVTEGGVIAAILELARAAKLGGTVELLNIPISEETLQISDLFHIDPLRTLGEGSLIISSRPKKTSKVLARLASNHVSATVVGRLSSKNRIVQGVSNREVKVLRYPTRDPYWQAYWTGIRKGWS